MKKFEFFVLNKTKHLFVAIIMLSLSMIIIAFIAFLNLDYAHISMIIILIIGTFLLGPMEKLSSYKINVYVSKNDLKIMKGEDIIFKSELDQIKIIKIKSKIYDSTSMKIITLGNKRFKFNCKDKGDDGFFDLLSHLESLDKNFEINISI